MVWGAWQSVWGIKILQISVQSSICGVCGKETSSPFMPYLAAHGKDLKDLLLTSWCSLSHYSACFNSSELFWRLEIVALSHKCAKTNWFQFSFDFQGTQNKQTTSFITYHTFIQLDIDGISLAKNLNRGDTLCQLHCTISLIAKAPSSWNKKNKTNKL